MSANELSFAPNTHKRRSGLSKQTNDQRRLEDGSEPSALRTGGSTARRLQTSEEVRNKYKTIDLKALASEAGLSCVRTYLYRAQYQDIREEFQYWAEHVLPTEPTAQEPTSELADLKSKLAKSNRKRKKYRGERDRLRSDVAKAANEIAYLSEQNRILRDQLAAERGDSVLQPHGR